jgi:hypothetical protein
MIHLLNRRQSRIVFFGSLRHLRAYNTRQSLHLKLNELALLALRCTILAILILLLAKLHLTDPVAKRERWIVVENGLQSDPAFSPMIDSLRQEGFLLKFLAPNFPDHPEKLDTTGYSYWGLAKNLAASQASDVIVLSYGYAERFWGQRIALPANVTWITTQPSPRIFALERVSNTSDSIIIREGHTSAQSTTFRHVGIAASQRATLPEILGETTVTDPDTLRITVVSDPDFEFDRKVITAAVRAIDESIPSVIAIIKYPETLVSGTGEDWIIWLSQRPLSNRPQTNCIVYRDSADATRPLTQVPDTNQFQYWTINKRLDESVLLEEGLMLQLALLLGPSERMNHVAESHDRRVLPEGMMWAGVETRRAAAMQTDDPVTPITLTLLLIGTLVAERLLAARRNQ